MQTLAELVSITKGALPKGDDLLVGAGITTIVFCALSLVDNAISKGYRISIKTPQVEVDMVPPEK